METRSVCDAISAEVVRRAPDWYGPGCVVTGPLSHIEKRRFSFFLRFLVTDGAGGANHVLVKIPRRPEIGSLAVAATEPESPGAIREYESLLAIDRLVRETPERGLASVRPLAFLDPWNAFAMEQIEGRTLKRIATSPRWILASQDDWRRMSRVFEAAGRWLSSFHESLGGVREVAVDVSSLSREAEACVDSIQASSCDGLQLESVRRSFQRALDPLAAQTDRVAVLHGDFMAANILVTPGQQVVVLDTHRAEAGSIHTDLARLAMDLPTLKQQVLTRGCFYREDGLRACRDALFRGYFGAGVPDPSRALVAFHAALAVTRKWCFHELRLSESRRIPARARRRLAVWMRPHFRRLISESLAR